MVDWDLPELFKSSLASFSDRLPLPGPSFGGLVLVGGEPTQALATSPDTSAISWCGAGAHTFGVLAGNGERQSPWVLS